MLGLRQGESGDRDAASWSSLGPFSNMPAPSCLLAPQSQFPSGSDIQGSMPSVLWRRNAMPGQWAAGVSPDK